VYTGAQIAKAFEPDKVRLYSAWVLASPPNMGPEAHPRWSKSVSARKLQSTYESENLGSPTQPTNVKEFEASGSLECGAMHRSFLSQTKSHYGVIASHLITSQTVRRGQKYNPNVTPSSKIF
jgi:hypothetical protein